MARPTSQVLEFDASRVRPLPGQPRKRFRGIAELAASITEVGQATPGLVTLVSGDADWDAQLIDGERRLRACKLAGVGFRAEVRKDAASADAAFAASFAANFGKQDHDAIEIAEGLATLKAAGRTGKQLAALAGKSDCWVSQHLSLLKLHPDVQAMMVSESEDEPRLTFQLAQLLTDLTHDHQLELAPKLVALSVAAARRYVIAARRDAGLPARKEHVTRARSLEALERMLEEVTDRIGIYLDMPAAELNGAIDSFDLHDRRQLARLLGEVAENLTGLAEAITARNPTLKRRAS